jgi:DNA-binding beta-propeller fold protein YncE
MSLVRWKVFSVAVFLAISTMTLSVAKAQDAQPMSEITLGSGTVASGGANDMSTMNGDSVAVIGSDGGTISSAGTAGPEAVAFDGTYIWVAMQFSNSVTRVRVKDGVVSGTFAVGKRPVALLYAASSIWVANLLSNNVTKLDPATGAVRISGSPIEAATT